MKLVERILGGEDKKNGGDEEDEEHQMDEICRSILYHRVCGWWEIFIKLSSCGLVKRQRSKDEEEGDDFDDDDGGIADTLVADLSSTVPRFLKGSRLGNRIWQMFHMGWYTFFRVACLQLILFNLNLSSVILYSRDWAVKRLVKNVSRGQLIDHTKCAHRNEVFRDDESLFKKLHWANQWFEVMGTNMTSIPGLGSTTLILVGFLLYVFLHYSQLMLRLCPIRIPYMSFLYHPRAMRRQVGRQMRQLIGQLMESLNNRCRSSREGLHKSMVCRHHQHLHHDHTMLEDYQRVQSERHLEDLRFLQLLVEVHNRRLARPVCVSNRWMRVLIKALAVMMISSMVIAFFAPFTCLICITALEIMRRTESRLKRIKCSSWHPMGVPLDDDLMELPELTDEQERRAYLEHDGSIQNLIRLATTIELNHFFTPAKCLFILSYVFLLFYIAILSTFFVNTFAFAWLDKFVWMDQLEEELAKCRQAISLTLEQGTSANGREQAGGERQLIKKLTVAYLNYELFRRLHKPFRPLARFYIIQAFVLALGGFFIFYLVGANVRTEAFTLISITMGCSAGVVNIYLAGISLVTKRMERIMREILRLLAHLTASQKPAFSRLYVVELWRRQCLTDMETRHFYATCLFGVHISYHHLLSFNLYAALVFLFLIKINSN